MLSTGPLEKATGHTCHHPSSPIQQACYKQWNGKPKLAWDTVLYWHWRTPVGVLLWTCHSKGTRWSRKTDKQSNHQKWLSSPKIWNVSILETLPVDTKPTLPVDTKPTLPVDTKAMTLHHQLLGGQSREKEAFNNLPWKDEKRPSSITSTSEVSIETLERLLRERWNRHHYMYVLSQRASLNCTTLSIVGVTCLKLWYKYASDL